MWRSEHTFDGVFRESAFGFWAQKDLCEVCEVRRGTFPTLTLTQGLGAAFHPAPAAQTDIEMPVGTRVCEGIYWDRMVGSPGWYEPPKDDRQETLKKILFLLNHVLDGDLNPTDYQPSRGIVPRSRVSYHNRPNLFRLKFIDEPRRQYLQRERITRDKLVYEPDNLGTKRRMRLMKMVKMMRSQILKT